MGTPAMKAAVALLALCASCVVATRQELSLLAAAADCTSVSIPASTFLQVKADDDKADDEKHVPPTNQNMDMDNPLNAATSYGVFSPGTTPHVKLSIGDLPERDRGSPEVMLPGSKNAAMPQIMFSDNDMNVQDQRLYAISVLRVLGGNAPNATCYCHKTLKSATGETFDELNCLCKNRADKPLCRLEEIFDKYAEANLDEVVKAAKARTNALLAAKGLAEPDAAKDDASTGPLEPSHKRKERKAATPEEVCAKKPCKNACSLRGVCLCGKCICEPTLKGDDCSEGAPGLGAKAPEVQAKPIGAPAGDPLDYKHPDHVALISDNPLLHTEAGRR